MKGILIEPGKAPAVTALPDTLQGIEALLQCPCEQKVLPRTPAVLVYPIYGRGLNRIYRGHLRKASFQAGPQPLRPALQTEMLNRLKEMEVRV